jgi:hypothetical protein
MELSTSSLYIIANFINPESVIAKPLILYMPLCYKINPVYTIHIIKLSFFFKFKMIKIIFAFFNILPIKA